VKVDGQEIRFPVLARLDTPLEITYYQHGGILQAVLRQLVAES
jgi:aconitate hydratase